VADSAGSGVERKLATVLFADLVGSTARASDEDPERVRLRMERFYEAMAAEIESVGGAVEKFAGDAVMAVFGVPAAFEDHAERALHATLAMRRRLQELFGDELVLRTGVNTGSVVFGRPREGSSFVSGDAVNVAARLEQAAAPGETLVGERTVSAVRGAFEFGGLQTVPAKGKASGIACRPLMRQLSLVRPRGLGGFGSAFVGRLRELERLQETYRSVVANRAPVLVLIAGDAGVGKTRIVGELWSWLARQQEPQPLLRTGRCLPYGQTAYSPLGEVLKEHFGLGGGDTAESVRARLVGHEALGLALGLDLVREVHPLRARDLFQDAWADLLAEVTAERPAVVVVEDLHWAEGPLLDLLEHVLGRVSGPLLLIATARPEFLEAHAGFARERVETAILEPLDAEVAHELLEELLGVDPPGPLLEVASRAEGNPFFLEELLAALVDQGVLERGDEGWLMHAVPGGDLVPDSVHAVVAARIDLLPQVEKEALQAAAVIGRVFWSGPVYELCREADPDLRLLEQRDFIRLSLGSSLEGEREYVFKHAVTREVAYASVPKARRAHLHAAFAAWVEQFAGRRNEYAPIIAHHYAQAVKPEDADLAWAGETERLGELRANAIEWLRAAAELALGRYEIQEGLALLRQALELEPAPSAESAIWQAIGRAHALNYDGVPFWAATERAIELSSDPVEIAELYSDLARETVLRVGMWRKTPDPARIENWIERALALMPAAGATRAKVLIARALWGGTADDAAEASVIAESTPNVDLRYSALAVRASVAFRERAYEDALRWSQEALRLAGSVSDPELVADPDLSAVWPSLALGRFDEARRHGARVHELNLGLTPHHRVHAVAIPMEVEELLGQWHHIRRQRGEAEAVVEANLDTPCVRNARTILLCAVAEEIAGNRETASALVEQAERLRMEGHGLVQEGPRLRLELIRGDLDAVRRLLGEDDLVAKRRTGYHLGRISIRLDALAALRDRRQVEEEAPLYLQPDTYLEPFALRALGIVRNDHSLLERGQQRFRAMGLEWHAAQTTLLAGPPAGDLA
jgi:class 3 adenylate cyclase/tetratricopeptide (TPR) repeat protein